MTLMMRQVIFSLFITAILTLLLLIPTFIAFPLQHWSDLWNITVFDVPFALMIITISLGVGMISGISYGNFWRLKLHNIDHHLNELFKGQKLSIEDDPEPIQDIKKIHHSMLELESKLQKQAKLSQRLATERANEREKSLQEVVVQERNRLARELHDSVSQQLFAASMMMSAINEGPSPKETTNKKQLSMVEKMIHQSQLEMRALLLHLRPVALKGKTLQEGMEELLTELIQKVPLEIEWKIESFTLDKGIEDQLFRILQESVSNTLRHAEASSLHVMLIERDATVIMRVVDDGLGFDVDEAKTSSYGLQNMHERALEIGGTLKIISLEKQGTRLEVKVPYISKEARNDD